MTTIDPLVIKHILKDKFDVYVKPESLVAILKDVLGNGIFAISHGPHAEDGGKAWSLQRKTASKVFTNNNFKSLMFETFSEHSNKVAEVINRKIGPKGDGIVELQTLMFRYTLDSIGNIGFGVNIDSLSQEEVPFAKAFDRAQALSFLRFLKPGWRTFPVSLLYWSSESELKQQVQILDDYIYGIIEKRKQEMSRGLEGHGDILTLFMQEKLGLSDLELRDVVISFLIAGRGESCET